MANENNNQDKNQDLQSWMEAFNGTIRNGNPIFEKNIKIHQKEVEEQRKRFDAAVNSEEFQERMKRDQEEEKNRNYMGAGQTYRAY